MLGEAIGVAAGDQHDIAVAIDQLGNLFGISEIHCGDTEPGGRQLVEPLPVTADCGD